MKYPCHLIEDLLPLYYDGVCSEKSNEDIKAHLSECAECNEKYRALGASEQVGNISINQEYEMQKAASLRSVKRRITTKRSAAILICVVIFTAIFLVYALMREIQVIADADGITVSMVDDAIVAQVHGDASAGVHSKLVVVQDEIGENVYLFFNIHTSVWDKLTASNNRTWDHTLRHGIIADSVEYVYYYTGDYTGIEMLSRDELQEIIDQSVLLWKK